MVRLAWRAAVLPGTFQDLLSAYGQAFQRSLGPVAALGVTVIAIGFAFLARGRAGLAWFGFASVVGSPTLYPPRALAALGGRASFGPECLWLFLGLDQWTHGLGISGAWLAIAFAGTALLVVRGDDLRLPGDLEPSRADVHLCRWLRPGLAGGVLSQPARWVQDVS